MNLSIVEVTYGSPIYQQVYNLREEVLRKPLGLSLANEDLSRDQTDTILAGLLNDVVVSCLMLHPLSSSKVQLRQMAVYDAYQGHGIGKSLVLAAEQFAIKQGYTSIILHARLVALGFYKTLGYSVIGDEYLEVGVPHYTMTKLLQ